MKMYKKLLQIIKKKEILNKAEYIATLWKSDTRKPMQKPHFIFSADNPMYLAKLKMPHEQVLQFLQDRGYKAEEMKGKYGDEERSIFVHEPPKHALKHLQKLAHSLGQESSIYSDGYNHELHYHHGENAGKHNKGQGTAYHKQIPTNYYSTLGNETFTHNFDVDNLHDYTSSVIKKGQEEIQKSENEYRLTLTKNEQKLHPLENARPDLKLIHYSPISGIETIDPYYHGVRGIGKEAQQGKPTHPMAFFYIEGTKPENIVMTGTKHKYVTSKGDMKFYDIGKDPDALRSRAKELAEAENLKSKYPNPAGHAVPQKQHIDRAIQEAGYHGMYNSSLNDTMKNVVGIYSRVPVEASYPIHPKDKFQATAENYHAEGENIKRAKDFAQEHGHHDGKMLHELTRKFNG